MQYLGLGLYPVRAPLLLVATSQWRGKVSGLVWSELAESAKTKSLRTLAKEYGVSHEAVRRVLARGHPNKCKPMGCGSCTG